MTNAPVIEFATRFNKQRKALPPGIKIAFRETLQLFLEDPNNPHLRNHLLKEKFAGYRSIDVTEDYRAIFKEAKIDKQRVIKFYLIGTHAQLYARKS